MQLTTEEVRRIATLGRLELTEDEVERYRTQLGSVLEYVAKLQEVDTKGIEEAAYGSVAEIAALRLDEAVRSDADTHTRLLEAFPSRQGNLLEVQAVFADRSVE
ncbi:Asp-tRNA(Asn)/Glu-tRNA(Gln) amidotransferase subunit GatC [Candidatus Uhrbacteria bacterium]|nr:Asp-tRNA(Asn)/Glu-tRNA(Gln) amidotransferase subunit GatC [Candidatus Uhrbacteria bacterium]